MNVTTLSSASFAVVIAAASIAWPVSATPRQPRGIYVVLNAAVPPEKGLAPHGIPDDLGVLVDNPAVAGLFVNIGWHTLEPAPGKYDFALLEKAFQAVEARHKTLQLDIRPGFHTPGWLLDQLPSCDQWLDSGGASGTKPPDCGKAMFEIPEGAGKGRARELPLPWNATYKRAWQSFITEVARRYGTRASLVSVAITGPTAISEEMILPREGPGETERWAKLLEGFYPDAAYHRVNRAFVEEWEKAIDLFANVFDHVTLVLTRSVGLPFNPPGREGAEISHMEVADYLAHKNVGTNGKSTQNNGIRCFRPFVMDRAKEMEANTSLVPRVLAGGEFATSFSRKPAGQGCPQEGPRTCPGMTPDQSLKGTLAVVFKGTPQGHFYGSEDGPARVQYLQIYSEDFVYASSDPAVQATLLDASKRILSMSSDR